MQTHPDEFREVFAAIPLRADVKELLEEKRRAATKHLTGSFEEAKALAAQIPTERLDKLEGKGLSDAFNFAADNSEKLGIGTFGWGVLKVCGFAAGLVGKFFPAAKPAIQKFALSVTGVQDKFDTLQKAVAQGKTLSQFNDGFAMGDKKPEIVPGATPVAVI
jgi:hypothetical protein